MISSGREGTVRFCPALIRLFFNRLAVWSFWGVVPKRLAIPERVSPGRTLYCLVSGCCAVEEVAGRDVPLAWTGHGAAIAAMNATTTAT